MTVFFRDDFNGSGALSGHAPDVNVFAGAAWAGDATNTVWGYCPYAVLSGGKMLANASGAGGIGNMLGAGSGVAPPETVVGGFVATWAWTPSLSSTPVGSASTYPALINFGSGGFIISDDGNPCTLGILGGPSALVTYSAGVTYAGELRVEPNKKTLNFLGLTLVMTTSGETAADIQLSPFYVKISDNNSYDFLMVESLPPTSPFWADYVNTIETI